MYKNGQRFDLIILDMCMDPINGIETATIILTSSIEYAVDGYKINAFRYLLKPINKENFLDLI